MSQKTIKSALISVFHKDGLAPIVEKLNEMGVTIYSTGGTQSFIEKLNIKVVPVEELTSYPSILGGRVKTLHPKVFGGILTRRNNESDKTQINEFDIPELDLVIVDLYPFEKTVESGASEQDIIEKIDIGGISLIRAAAKNFKDVTVISSMNQYSKLLSLLNEGNGSLSLENRKEFAKESFAISSHYDTHIFNYFAGDDKDVFKESILSSTILRYGENPHQKGVFYGELESFFDKLHGKELSYNNLLDVDAAVNLMLEFNPEVSGQKPTFAILKHNNACGIASRNTISEAYKDALAGDPVSAFGGVLISNTQIDEDTAVQIHTLFCEVVIAPSYSEKALEILKGKKNRVLLVQKKFELQKTQFRTILNGVLVQDKDLITDRRVDFKTATTLSPTEQEMVDLEFASKICKNH